MQALGSKESGHCYVLEDYQGNPCRISKQGRANIKRALKKIGRNYYKRMIANYMN